MTRAIDPITELPLFRAPGHRSELFLAIHVPNIMYTARVLSTPSTTDMVTQIPFYLDDGCVADCLYGGGNIADVLPGMTMLVGTTPYGHERGIIRIREVVAGTPFEVSEGSSIDIQADDFLTVLDEFSIWPRHLKLSGVTPLMDSNITYVNQHTNFKPVPVLGSDRVVWLTGATVTVEFDASDSWVLDSAIKADPDGYTWIAKNASATADMNTDHPTITYDAEGTYRVDLTIEAATGETETTHRNVFVFSESVMPVTDFNLKSCGGSVSNGGWSFEVEMAGQSDLTTVRDRTKVVLFARDYYGNTEQSIGYLTGCENIIAWGWIAEESILWHPEKGRVEFSVQGAQYWLKAITLFPVWIEQNAGITAAWTNMSSLTVDKVYHHLMTWRTTFVQCCDFFRSGDTRNASRLESGAGDVWSQMGYIVRETILADPLCNRYNQLFINIDPQVSASRAFPVVQILIKEDWLGSIELERRTIEELSLLSLSGISVNTGNASISYFSLANGHVFKRYGRSDMMERLLLSSQAQANSLAGMIMAWRNNPYPPFRIRLAGNHRLFDICPNQFASITIALSDTDREIEYAGHLIPRNVSFDYDKGTLFTQVSFEAETFEDLNINGDIPGGEEFPAESSSFKKQKFPALPVLSVIGGVTYPPGTAPSRVLVHDPVLGLLYTKNFNEPISTAIVWKQMNWGLTLPVYQGIHNMILTSGAGVYIADNDGIWYASSPESPYTQIVSQQDIWDANSYWQAAYTGAGYSVTDILIKSIGYDPNSGGLAGIFNLDTRLQHFFTFNSTGIQSSNKTDRVYDDNDGYGKPDKVSYGGGKWILTHATGAGGLGQYISRYDTSGTWIDIINTGLGSAVTDGPTATHSRLGTSGKILLRRSMGVVEMRYDEDNGLTPGTPIAMTFYPKILVPDISGQYHVAVDRINNETHKSSDGGSSWSGIVSYPASTINIPKRILCLDADRWIVTGGSISAAFCPIVFTPDFLATFTNGYGNLGVLFPSTAFTFDLVQALP